MKILKNDKGKLIKIMNYKIKIFSEEIKWEYQFLSNSTLKGNLTKGESWGRQFTNHKYPQSLNYIKFR